MKRPYLSVENAMREKQLYPLMDTITIGRSKDNVVVLPENIVSRAHAAMRFQGGIWIIEDLGSANGIIWKGEHVTKIALNVGDSFQIGLSIFRIVEQQIADENISNHKTQLMESDGIVESLRRCFDAAETFDRQVFLEQTKLFAPYHERVFPLLLNYLKRAEDKNSRICLINTIPNLYDHVKGTRIAVRMLLKEFCTQAESINYYDRNMLMLAAQLLRHYRKEDGVDIETTPVEVLQVQEGLLADTVRLGQTTVAELNKEVLQKLSTMHTALINSLSKNEGDESVRFSPRFLFNLLREFYILMALLGGPQSKTIVWEGALATSSPKSRLYAQPLSTKFFGNILGLLRIIVRSCHRLMSAEGEGPENLKALKHRVRSLTSLAPGEREQNDIQQLQRLLDGRAKSLPPCR